MHFPKACEKRLWQLCKQIDTQLSPHQFQQLTFCLRLQAQSSVHWTMKSFSKLQLWVLKVLGRLTAQPSCWGALKINGKSECPCCVSWAHRLFTTQTGLFPNMYSLICFAVCYVMLSACTRNDASLLGHCIALVQALPSCKAFVRTEQNRTQHKTVLIPVTWPSQFFRTQDFFSSLPASHTEFCLFPL